MSILLKAENVTKSYAGVQALRTASFELKAGEVHALIGENGAGKSTFIKILTGAVEADSGKLEIDGKIVRDNSPTFAKSLGVAAIYQQPALFPEFQSPKISRSDRRKKDFSAWLTGNHESDARRNY